MICSPPIAWMGIILCKLPCYMWSLLNSKLFLLQNNNIPEFFKLKKSFIWKDKNNLQISFLPWQLFLSEWFSFYLFNSVCVPFSMFLILLPVIFPILLFNLINNPLCRKRKEKIPAKSLILRILQTIYFFKCIFVIQFNIIYTTIFNNSTKHKNYLRNLIDRFFIFWGAPING